jgi:pimeloyl-ACP methyl ester carboxylesterase
MSWLLEPWVIALLALVAVLAVFAATWLHLWFWMRRYGLPMPYDHFELIRAPDGGTFELRRVLPTGQAVLAPPVLLVHGICANHRNLDLNPDASLARFLAARGRDVWLLTLRSGRTRRWREGVFRPAAFESMMRHDVPIGIARVRELTGAEQLDYVGFSMGGMLLYASIGRTVEEAHVRRVAVVGAPGRIQPPVGVPRFLRFLPRHSVPPILTGFLGTGFAFLSEWLATPMHRMILNPKNMGPGMTKLALVECVQDVPGTLLADFMIWSTTGGVVRVQGKDILDGLHHVKVPALFVAGADDRVGTARAVHAAFDAWGSKAITTKRFLVLGKASGTEYDYGHGDLSVSHRLAQDLYPALAQFIDENEPPQLPAALEEVAERA